ncbi:MAG: alpha/beta hydrolase [bacterium]|nr:alpha/beta hydrolase [bacterium]
MISLLFLGVSLVGAAFSASSLIQVRRLWYFTFPYFMGAWLTSELALHHIAWQAAATIGFVAFGALEQWQGVLGLVITFASWGALLIAHRRAGHAGPILSQVLDDPEFQPLPKIPVSRLTNPFSMKLPGVEHVRDIAYCDVQADDKGRRNLLDVIKPAAPGENRPVLLHIHGGGWVIGEKEQQGQPLMNYMASRGWVCVASNYRLSPKATFPAHIIDVKRAIAWIQANIREHGGDPSFICIAGGSAGGHLSSLAALTPNDPAFQPGFEDVDTKIAAAVPFYGVYDFLDRHEIRGSMSMKPMLERMVLKCSPEESRDVWENASPIARVSDQAPSFFVIHGTHDSLVFIEEARVFVDALREKSKNPVHYAEIPGAQHAFEIFNSRRSERTVEAVGGFLERVYRER